MKKNRLLIFVLVLTSFYSHSQIKIYGKVNAINNKHIPFGNIVLKDIDKNIIIGYTYANINGEYILITDQYGKFIITFSALAYEEKKIAIELTKRNRELKIDVILKNKSIKLNEIILNTEPITIKKDTIVFSVKAFTKGNEQVVEDLLKNIPGLNIDAAGTIKVGNQEIEKVMVDGDDFFEKGYKILTKNMPTNSIAKVEIYKKYSNNKLLKGIEESEKVALNLILKEDAKRQWFGNVEAGYDMTFSQQYTLKSNLMNFGKKNKYYFLTNFNNIGYDATGDVSQLIKPFRYGEPGSIGDNESANKLLGLYASTPEFKASRTNFNNTELASLNAIFNPTKKLKIKTLGFFNWDEQDFYRKSVQVFGNENNGFTNTEDYKLRKRKFIGFGKIDLSYDISKTKMLEATTKYNNQQANSNSDLIFNGDNTKESLKTNNELFDQKITFTNKIKKNRVFLLTGRYIHEKAPQIYHNNTFLFQDLFPDTKNINNVNQLSENQMQFAGFEAHLLDRNANGNLLEFQFGNQFRKDNLNTSFYLKSNDNIVDTPVDYQNSLSYYSNDIYFNSKYRLKLKNFAFTTKLEFHQLINQLEQVTISKQQPFFINPKIGFDWNINKNNKILASYSYNTTNAKILDVYKNYVLINYRSFSKGTGEFNQLNASTAFFNYQLGNWSNNFFANVFVIYNKNHDFFSTNSTVIQNYVQSEKILIKDREMLSINANIDRYFNVISSNLKINLGYNKSNYKNIVNNSGLREVTANNYNYGFELRSGFTSKFNYHFGTKWSTNQIETTITNIYTNNMSFLDLSYIFNEKFNVDVKTERYFFGNVDKNNSTYYFADLEARYKLKENKLTFSLSGKNLFNTETFKTFTIDDISTTTTEYRLLPRLILLKVEYRF